MRLGHQQPWAATNSHVTLGSKWVQNLTGPIQDAIALQQQLVYLHSIPNLAALTVAITTVNQTVTMINNQKAQIDGWVKDRRDNQPTGVLKTDETAVEEMIDAWCEQQAIFATEPLFVG